MKLKKFMAVAVAVALVFSGISFIPIKGSKEVLAGEDPSVNIGVDLNGDQNRPALASTLFNDWIYVPGETDSKEIDGISFTLSNGDPSSTAVIGAKQNKTLVNGTDAPVLTCDGALLSVRGGTIKLEIAGLPAGNHTITSWHSFFTAIDEATTSDMEIYVDGVKKTTVIPTKKVADDKLAGIAYTEFSAEEGKNIIIEFKSLTNGNISTPVVNAFEIDGAHPVKSIVNALPADKDIHYDKDTITWSPGAEAVSHDVYFGSDFSAVKTATRDSKEYKGNQTECSYSFGEISNMLDYFWRVDEIDSEGNICKGKIYSFQKASLAFPTAEGYGRYAKGGRGGRVLEVTSLADTEEEGTLRWALTIEKGPRIIVFKVGGVIALTSKLIIPNDGGDVYVAGQTAPGDGITLINYSLGVLGASDVVIRNVRVRVGDMNGAACDGMGLGSADHSIVDHCSISWATDEGFSSRGAKNITFQRNIIAESLHDSVHYNAEDRTQTETHAFAASISGNIGSFHHNLLVNCTGRNWSLAGGVESDGKTYAGYLDVTNNIIYNYTDRTTDGGVRRLNFVNNYYKKGATSRDMQIMSIDGDELNTGDMQMAYVSGNMLVESDGTPILNASDDAWEKGYAIPGQWGTIESVKSDVPFFPSYINTDTAEEAYASVTKDVGATKPAWDYLDSRYIKEVTTGTYTYKGSKQSLRGIIDSQNDVGGYPDETKFKGGEAYVDTDHDGMPDTWENENGLNPEDPADGSIISLSAEEYTNVEMYLDELAGDPLKWAKDIPTPTPIPTATPTIAPTATPTIIPTATPLTPTETPVVTAAPTPIITETNAPLFELGDVNRNNTINAEDALLTLKIAAKLIDGDEEQMKLADIDKDTTVTAKDALGILKLAAKIISSFDNL